MAAIKVSVHTRRPHRSHGYYCAICPFSSGGNIIQKKKKEPYADYDSRPRPMAWARVITSQNILHCGIVEEVITILYPSSHY